MYSHQNISAVSTGSGRRISSNNPFRSALLQEEQNRMSEDQQYNSWLAQRIEEEKDKRASSYSSDDINSFSEGDELDFSRPPARPASNRSHSAGSRNSNNPFAAVATTAAAAAPPPAYHDVVVNQKYAKDEYPRDEKNSYSVTASPAADARDDDVNPFPSTPRRSSRRAAPPPPPPSGSRKLNVETMTNTTTTKILPDGRVRSKSTGDPINAAIEKSQREKRETSDRRYRDDERREHRDRSHRHEEYDNDRPRRSHTHSGHRHSSSRRKKFIQEKSKKLDTIDRLDVTGFFGGAKFHHDGPFDACIPQRNKDVKAAPVAAFPADGPNNSIRGIQPNKTKNDQYDMAFGNFNPDGERVQNTYLDSPVHEPYKTKSNSNTTVASTDNLATALSKARISQFDVTNTKQLHGDESLGLGTSTFMDGAPVYGSNAQDKDRNTGGLTRKKTLLGRMKTIVKK
ncbi:Pal2 protein [Martiniozyma asiatica (nom. inval.)]|nr:Pal2 protein [Martiniozyma asiatica]